jgi:hypothetical protein
MHPPPLSDFLLKLGMAYSEHQGERRTRPRAELQEGVEAHATAWASAIRLRPRRLSGVRAAQAAASAPPLLSTASPPGMRGELPQGDGELGEKGGKGHVRVSLNIHVCKYMHTYAYPSTHAYTRMQGYIPTYISVMHTYTHTYPSCIRTHVHIRTSTQTYIHPYSHTYAYIHTTPNIPQICPCIHTPNIPMHTYTKHTASTSPCLKLAQDKETRALCVPTSTTTRCSA